MPRNVRNGLAVLLGLALACAASAPAQQLTISQSISAGDYQITTTPQGHRLSVPGLGRLLVPGKPNLPSKIYAIAIPPGAQLVNVDFDPGPAHVLPGAYGIPPAPLPRVIGQEDPAVAERDAKRYQQNFDSTYGSDAAYPERIVEFVRTAGFRKYNLVDVRVTPFTYHPRSGQLTYYPQITVHVHYSAAESPGAIMVDNLPRTEQTASKLIINYDQATSWYPQARTTGRGAHEFVIITLDSLTIPVSQLRNWEVAKGRTAAVVTTSWISANYSGYDLPEQIRNFLREKYPSGEWGIQDVLFVGHYDDVPMRRVAQDLGYGQPETDYYYAELSLPDDQSWDADGDHQWGEDSDPIDFYSEVNVGRIPWSGSGTVSSICAKSVAYEQNDDPSFKKNILLLGAFFWDNDPNPRTDNAVLMEAKVDQPWMAGWTMTRMYEEGYSTYPMDYDLTHSNVVSVWSAGTFAFVNWAGHGSPTSAHIYHSGGGAFIESADCAQLNDDYPAIIFADACSNSDTDYENIGQSMMEQGAVGFLGATKVAYGCPGWADPYDGSSQSLDYFFTTYVTSGNYTQGQAHQQALTDMYVNGLWDNTYFETFEWGALWGNPDLAIGPPPPLTISLPAGLPEYLEPGTPTTCTVEISDGVESYVADSGLLHYRYYGGSFGTSPLTHVSGDLYEATLPPAACDAVPEYYFSADGDGGSTIYSPADAPNTLYTATVGTVVTIATDDFETDQGWTTDDDGQATSGFWQRGVPVDDPNWEYAPASDSDGSGQCWLTENDNNPLYPDPWNTDVDDGAVMLISPTIDLSAGDVAISYDYYLRLTDDNGVDRLLVEIDSNDGAGPWIEIACHDTNGGQSWQSHKIEQADLDAAGVTLTTTMKLRFTANDADPQSINESGLDAFLITKFTCSEPYDLGDLNCDGSVNGLDIDAFVLVLSGTPPDYTEYYTEHPDCNHTLADCNEDGSVNGLDIDPFVDVLAG